MAQMSSKIWHKSANIRGLELESANFANEHLI